MFKPELITIALAFCGTITVAQTQNIHLNKSSIQMESESHLIGNEHLIKPWIKSITQDSRSSRGMVHTLDSTNWYLWDPSQNQFVLNELAVFSYDSNDNVSVSEIYRFEPVTLQKVPSQKNQKSYDSNGNLQEIIYFSWNSVTNTWGNRVKYEFFYDANQYLEYNKLVDWDDVNGLWVNKSKFQYFYDLNNNNTDQMYQTWDTVYLQWVDRNKYELFWNANDEQIGMENYTNSSGSWVNSTKNIYSINAIGNRTSNLYQHWDPSANSWIDKSLYEYTYDIRDNVTLYSRKDWVMSSSSWESVYESLSFYDFNVKGEDVIFPGGYNQSNMVVGNTSYFTPNPSVSMTLYDSTAYFYSTQTNGIAEISGVKINVFPNPVMDYISFDITNLKDAYSLVMFDISGKVVMDKIITSSTTVNVTSLKSGLYTFKLEQNGELFYGKFVK